MASLINAPLLDKTGKEIVAALTGEEFQPSASQYNAPISDRTGKQILEAIQQGGGGSEPFVVTFSGSTNDDNAACDKTYEEIQQAVVDGKSIKGKYSDENLALISDLLFCESGGNYVFSYSAFEVEDGEPVAKVLISCWFASRNSHALTISAAARFK